MAKRVGGLRRKTRSLLSKSARTKGKLSLSKYFQTFKPGEKVALKAEPSVQKGMFGRRFAGKIGVVDSKRGNCYMVKIKDIGKEKLVVVHPVHLKKHSLGAIK
ncbi:50S ribosomal protein L21e [Nanoarchaeota archaeon]